MLTHLSISNYAIIEELDVDFTNGFTVITGETGAGKSILLGALSLILGQRVDTSVLNDKEKKCIIEGIFNVSKDKFNHFFINNDLDYEQLTSIRREISSSGKSRAFINDTPVTLNILKELSDLLFDIHSQHQTLEIKGSEYQINVIDSFASTINEVILFKKKYEGFIELKEQLKQLIEQEKTAKNDFDYINFQIEEISSLNLKENEQIELEEQLELINNAEDIKQSLHLSSEILSNTESNTLSNLKTVLQSLAKISHCSNEYSSLYERLQSLNIELNDIAEEIERLNDHLDFDAEQATFINERLSKIYSLEKKHNLSNSNELLEKLAQFESQLSKTNSLEEDIEKLKLDKTNLDKELMNHAEQLSEKRKAVFNKLEKDITEKLVHLGMPDATFKIKHQKTTHYQSTGIDEISFLFSANKGYSPIELSKAASGGELSRLMLTIKSILSQSNNIETILFDEIDTGVSGDVADKMGDIMKKISESIQVISITHLPQVAAKASTHIKIYKETNHQKTLTSLKVLNQEERVEEIAKMLSGKELSKAAYENARNLISN